MFIFVCLKDRTNTTKLERGTEKLLRVGKIKIKQYEKLFALSILVFSMLIYFIVLR